MNSQNNNHVMYLLVQRLCESFVPAQHDNFNRICQCSLDLITMKKLKFDSSDEQYLLSKVRDNFFREGRYQESTMFDDLYHKLKISAYRSINIGELICCFYFLSNFGDETGNNILSVANNLQRIQVPENDYESIDLNAHYIGTQNNGRFASHDVALRRNHYGSMASLASSRPHTIHGEPGLAYEVVNRQSLLGMDLVNIFQGIPGKYITFKQNEKFTFQIERIAEFASNDVFLAKRLSVVGQHFKIIRNCATLASGNTSKGFVFQSFGSALEDQVRDFYKLMTSIQANFHNSSSVVTMHKLTVWIYETATKFEALSNMTAKCKSKRGGALVAVIYDFMNHGDPIVRDTVRAILSKVVKPIRQMMNHWIFYGELKDDFREFFISVNDTAVVGGNDFWRDKYIINKQMLPGFISKDQAFKILNTGKAISMLREVENKVNLFLPVYDQLKMSFENSKLETLFVKRGSVTQSSDFSHLLDYLYKEICQVALNLLNQKYTLHGHFYAHKRYLLFGQGDFISYLVEVLSPMMGSVVPSKMKIYSLSPCLEQAILKTSANCENTEILSRLDIHIGNTRNRFSLKYKADGPLATIFTEQTQIIYAKTFDLLWTLKRFNNNTQKYFIQLRMMFKFVKRLPPTFLSINNNFSSILHQIVQFLNTIESYFSSTIENRWQNVKNEIDNPVSLDRLIKAHRKFLCAIERQLFFTESPELNIEFNKICDQIWEFYNKLDEYITPIYKMATENGGEQWEDELKECYKQYDCEYPIWLVNFSKTFNLTVVNFLENLVETEEDDLQELCLCVDFNRFYKRTILAN